jgi:hypothetical protein
METWWAVADGAVFPSAVWMADAQPICPLADRKISRSEIGNRF